MYEQLSLSLEEVDLDIILDDAALQKEKEKYNLLQRKYKTALRELSDTKQSLEIALSLKAQREKLSVCAIQTSASETELPEAIPIIMWSDWHVGERVAPETVEHVNYYSPEVCSRRADILFENTVNTLLMLKHSYTIRNVIIWLGGDFISGHIHEELMESNYLSPPQEILYVANILKRGINKVCEQAGIEVVHIPCNFGNHGRLTHKTRASTGHINNLEWMMYSFLAQDFEDNPKVTFMIADGPMIHYEVFDKRLRFTHGDAVSYSGSGMGGPSNSILRWINKQDASSIDFKADMTFLGHFHTTIFDRRFTVNNCLIGATPYSIRCGFPIEPADQALVLLEKAKGFTLRYTVAAE
jgi:hypothetical protein